MKQHQLGGMLFYSSHPSDSALCEQLARALRTLVREAHLSEWSAQQILAGTDVAQERKRALKSATLILLLLSANYLHDDECHQELLDTLERQQRGEVRVIPILLRPCDWRTPPLATLEPLPRNGRAVTTWNNRDRAFLDITQEIRQVVGLPLTAAHSRSTREQQYRIQLSKRVQKIWIEGLLEHSLHQAVRLDLHIQDQPDVLQNPLHMQVQELKQAPRPLPAGTSITQVYDEADGKLLILGEPGAGKTMQLLELAHTLLTRAEYDPAHPLPVIFPLSSWAQKHLPLADWIVEELVSRNYEVPPRTAQGWVETGRIVPLLDGLDEVAEDVRADCVQAIADYYQHRLEQGETSLVVCCRSQESAAFAGRLPLQRAVSILPLTEEQVDQYLLQTGNQLEALQDAIHDDAELAELARRPLMLNIFTLAYQEVTAVDLPAELSREATLHAVFATYIEQMLIRRGQLRTGTKEQIRQWLIFLAQQMLRHNQTVFFVENLQPDWLSGISSFLYGLSIRLFVGLPYALVFGLPIGLVFVLAFGLHFGLVFGLTTAALVFEEMGAREMGTLKNLAQTYIRLEMCSNLL